MVTNAQIQTQIEGFHTSILESIAEFKKTSEENNNVLLDKIGTLNARIDNFETQVNEISEAQDELVKSVDDYKVSNTNNIQLLVDRITLLEGKVATLEPLTEKVKNLTELCEERTNRQLRETLVFRNVPEVNNDESYADTKDLLAKLISDHCDNISYEEAYGEIKRAHRETKRRNNENHYRAGKRLIFAAFHSWDLCRQIIETFRLKCIREPAFVIAADQKYGPLTSRRRSLALKKRKELKDNGDISGGYINFPAKLMVNVNGQVDNLGKKIYSLHTDFSKHDVQ